MYKDAKHVPIERPGIIDTLGYINLLANFGNDHPRQNCTIYNCNQPFRYLMITIFQLQQLKRKSIIVAQKLLLQKLKKQNTLYSLIRINSFNREQRR